MTTYRYSEEQGSEWAFTLKNYYESLGLSVSKYSDFSGGNIYIHLPQ
jgi:hypothetical protein